MGSNFTVYRKQGYVEGNLRGHVTENVSKRLWESIFKECTLSNCKKILGTCERSNSRHLKEEFSFVNRFSEIEGIREYKIAWVELNSTAPEAESFTETMLRNRGINTRTFQNVQDALAWLLS